MIERGYISKASAKALVIIALLLGSIAVIGQSFVNLPQADAARDKIAPSISISSPANGATVTPTSIKVQGTTVDNVGGSGVKLVQVRLDGGTYSTATPNSSGDWSVWSETVNIATTGSHTIYARVADKVGNYMETSVTVSAQLPIIDTSPPTVSASPSGGTFSSAQSVVLTSNEPATIYYTTDGTTPTTLSPVYLAALQISTTTALKFFGKDLVGNSGSVITQVYTINTPDITPPSVAIISPVANSVVTSSNGKILVTGVASDNSGVQLVEVRIDNGSYFTAVPKAPGDWSTWSISISATAGDRRIVPRATDMAGNQAWNSIYVTVADPSTTTTSDKFGIAKLYPTANGGNEWYVNMNDPKSDPSFRNLPTMTKQADGSWQVSASQVRMEAWSPDNQKWQNVEITEYAKIVGGTNELLQMYSRGGHHTDTNQCLGSAYKGRLYGDGHTAFVKEITHPAYTSNRGSVQATSEPLKDRWIGFKTVIYNFVVDGKTYVRMESYIDDSVTDATGNLVIKNNWKLASAVEDRGGWATTNSDFNPSCFPTNKDSTFQYRQRDEIHNLPGGTATQNIGAFRSDDLTWDWKYLSVREISAPTL